MFLELDEELELGCRKGAAVLAAMSVREMGDRRRASTTAMEARARDRLDGHDIVCSLGTWVPGAAAAMPAVL